MVKPIIPYIGGKQRLAKKILPYFPKHACYVEPFAGGLAMMLSKERSKCEVINDISGDLICLYRVIQNHREEFERHFEYQITSRKQFEDLTKQDTALLTDIQKAVRFFYLQKLNFGGGVKYQNFGTVTEGKARLNTDKLKSKLLKFHERLRSAVIENLDWSKIVEKYDRSHSLFYCDPPYWKTAGYGVPFEWEQYEKLAVHMKSIKGMMVVSINDHPDIRKLFKDFKIVPLQTTYTCGKQRSKAKELLILNTNATKNMETKKAVKK